MEDKVIYTCINKEYDSNHRIIMYELLRQGAEIPVKITPDRVKELVKSGYAEVTNLKLTSDNRLISTSTSQTTTASENSKIPSKTAKPIWHTLNNPGGTSILRSTEA